MENRKRTFNDDSKLHRMLLLREQGYSLPSLGFIFGVDISTICYHLERNETKVKQDLIKFSLSNLISLVEVKVKIQKSYADYLRESYERSRRASQLTNQNK